MGVHILIKMFAVLKHGGTGQVGGGGSRLTPGKNVQLDRFETLFELYI